MAAVVTAVMVIGDTTIVGAGEEVTARIDVNVGVVVVVVEITNGCG